MQLSLPLPVYSTPAAASAATNSPRTAADPSSKDTTCPNHDSFESLLKNDAPADDAADEGTEPDSKKAAEMAAALLWMPMVPPTPAPDALSLPVNAASVSADLASAGETETPDGSVCYASQSSRAFAPTLKPLGAEGQQSFTAVTPDAGKLATGPMNRGEKDSQEKSVNIPALGERVPPSGEVTEAANVPVVPLPFDGEAGEGETPGDSALLAALPAAPANPAVPTKLTAGSVTELSQVAAALGTDVSMLPTKRVAVAARVPSAAVLANPAAPAVVTVTESEISPSMISPAEGLASAVENTAGAEKSSGQEKNAATQLTPELEMKNLIKSEGKSFLDAGRKLVATVGARVGTSVAKLGATMSAAASTQSKTVSISDPAIPFVFSGETASTGTLTAEAPTPAATVRETIATILSAVEALERRADVQQKSVDLNLSVGHEKVGLRVELRDGSVHTTFRTESSEMNSALAHEWRSIVQPTGERGLRLAEPVFTAAVSPAGESAFGSLGQGAPQHREPKAPTTFVSALKREFYDSSVTESPAKDSPAVSSSQLLNVLA